MSLELKVHNVEGDEGAIQARFDSLQTKLVPLWQLIEDMEDSGEQTIVILPSLTVEFAALQGSILQAYEERFLFLLLLLRQPRARLIYLTSQPIQPNIIDYYLGLLPGVISSHARGRLHLLSPHDGAPQPLSVKLLQRPRLLEKIRQAIPDPDRAHLVPFNTTRYERDVALRLGVPMYGADPKHNHYGSKSGCRRLFRETGVPIPAGHEDLHTMDDLIDATQTLASRCGGLGQVMVKHNEGVSGDGNAIVDLRDLDLSSRGAVEQRLRAMRLESDEMDFDAYMARLKREGGIIEERVQGQSITSPSTQLRVTPLGRVELLSTHDQLLGGDGGKYVGCLFPADAVYAKTIAHESMKVGEHLAREGVLGRFGIDFVCAQHGPRWDTYAIELNLRKGGTTHPFLTLQFLTDGRYDADAVEFVTDAGPKYYVATDAMTSQLYRLFSPDDVFDIAVRHGLHFDQTRQKGVVFHMLSAIGDQGRLGLTAIGNSPEEAQQFYDRTRQVLDEEAREASQV